MRWSDRRGYVLFVLCAVYALSALDRNILAILLQPIQRELLLSDTQLGFLSGLAFALFYVSLAIPIAHLADLWKRTKVIALSLGLFSVMTALCSAAASFGQLLALRVGVGIGEAGTTPSSTAIISDLYPEKSRATAMALFAIGGFSGVFLGFAVGGIVAESFGWRSAFFVAGVPGLLLALLIHFTVREPARARSPDSGPLSSRQVCLYLLRQPSIRHLTAGVALILLFTNGFQTWLPSFLQRSFAMSVAETGFVMGVPFGALSIAGMLCAGVLVDRLGERDVRWRSWVVSAGIAITFPFCVMTALAQTKLAAIAAYAIPAALGAAYIGPAFALVQSLSPPSMRALAMATVIGVANVIGSGLGPQVVGVASDAMHARFGTESLRYALLMLTPVLVWAALHFYWAAQYLSADLARARKGAALCAPPLTYN
jgi:MFS family permease